MDHEEVTAGRGHQTSKRKHEFDTLRHLVIFFEYQASNHRIGSAASSARRPSAAARMQPAIVIPERPARQRPGMAWNSSGMNRNRMPATTTVVVQRNSA